MPVDTPHKDYSRMLGRWKRCDDVYAGQDAVHDAGSEYLPMLKDQSSEDYAAYVKRAIFYNATYRTISGLVGMIFRQPPHVKVPESVEELMEDVTMSGVPLQMLAQEVAVESLKKGRVGLLVDYPSANPEMTQADARLVNLRPSIQIYKATSIINWKTASVNNRRVLTQLVLKECDEVTVDEFSSKDEDQWRVLDLVEGQEEGRVTRKYRQRLFKRHADADVQIGGDIIPLMNNKPLDYIPFVFIGADSISDIVEDPPLIDLVNVNLSHYRTTADYEHGAHFTGLPTPVITGYKSDTPGEKMYVGSSHAWVFPSKEASVKYLEFTGQGLGALKDILARKEQHMAILGARMLEPQKTGVEAAETAGMHRKGEESTLAGVSQCISMGLERALKWFTEWAGADPEEVECELNRDFFPTRMLPAEVTVLVAAWQANAISDQTLFANLQRGEIISQEVTFEEEQERISASAMKLTGQPPEGSSLPPLNPPKPGEGEDRNAG
jgi:hypothetical protein